MLLTINRQHSNACHPASIGKGIVCISFPDYLVEPDTGCDVRFTNKAKEQFYIYRSDLGMK